MRLEAVDVRAGYGQCDVLSGVSFALETGEALCLLGPNGVGKSTLFKSLLGFLPLRGGSFLIDGKRVPYQDRKGMAKLIGYVPQSHEPPFPFRVLDVVVMGSLARSGVFSGPSREEFGRAARILDRLGASHLRDCVYTEISGRERQMVLIARALMQEPHFLVMDEPTANLDFGNQMRVLQQVRLLARSGMGIMMTSHVPDHAFFCCSQAAILSPGLSFRVGAVEEVLTEPALREAYGIDVRILRRQEGRWTIKTCVPVPRESSEE